MKKTPPEKLHVRNSAMPLSRQRASRPCPPAALAIAIFALACVVFSARLHENSPAAAITVGTVHAATPPRQRAPTIRRAVQETAPGRASPEVIDLEAGGCAGAAEAAASSPVVFHPKKSAGNAKVGPAPLARAPAAFGGAGGGAARWQVIAKKALVWKSLREEVSRDRLSSDVLNTSVMSALV